MDSLLKVLKHEIAHHICHIKGKTVNHEKYFKDICLKIDACLPDELCTGKYSNLNYKGIDTPYLWEYKCPNCFIKFYTKRALNKSETVCADCGFPIKYFIKKRI